MRFNGKVAIVTGSGQGIGRSIAMALAADGAKVVTNNRKQGTKGGDAATTAAEIKAAGGQAIPCFGNISDYQESQKLIQTAVDHFGKIDILVNNAAILLNGPLVNYTEKQIREIVDINLTGCIFCCQHVIPYMAKQKYGKIVNISSGAALQGDATISVYSATKYAILGLTESLAVELAFYNINVNAVCPGGVPTRMNFKPGATYDYNFFHREITGNDIAAAVLFLASEEARNITSSWLPVTAGVEKKVPDPKPFFTI
ncbi:MAG: SDR family NAD(P)-dependent oxidoreductase [Dehalococcoidales bacterium]